jgi:hypothetical protein
MRYLFIYFTKKHGRPESRGGSLAFLGRPLPAKYSLINILDYFEKNCMFFVFQGKVWFCLSGKILPSRGKKSADAHATKSEKCVLFYSFSSTEVILSIKRLHGISPFSLCSMLIVVTNLCSIEYLYRI